MFRPFLVSVSLLFTTSFVGEQVMHSLKIFMNHGTYSRNHDVHLIFHSIPLRIKISQRTFQSPKFLPFRVQPRHFLGGVKMCDTLPETKIFVPENPWLENEMSFWDGQIS